MNRDVIGCTNMADAVSGCVLRTDICTRIKSKVNVTTVVHVGVVGEWCCGYRNDRTPRHHIGIKNDEHEMNSSGDDLIKAKSL